jgi:hypothetical protein
MKISPWVFLVVAIMLSVVVLSYSYFHFYDYHMKEADMLDAQTQALQAEAAKMPAAKKRVEDAKAEVDKKAKEWQAIVAVKTPPQGLSNGGIDLSVNPYQLTVDSQKFRNNIQRAVNAQARRGGVKVINGPRVPSPSDDPTQVLSSYYNYPAIPYPVVIFELGQVEVTGTYSQITQNVRSWASMPNYMAVASGLAIDGTGSTLHGTYSVAIVGYIRGDKMSAYLPGQMPTNTPPPTNGSTAPGKPPVDTPNTDD